MYLFCEISTLLGGFSSKKFTKFRFGIVFPCFVHDPDALKMMHFGLPRVDLGALSYNVYLFVCPGALRVSESKLMEV